MTMRRRKHCFSLVELIVSIAVFVLIMVMMLNFFSGAREIWIGTRSRGDAFVEAKAALDFVSELISQARMMRDNGDYSLFSTSENGVERFVFICRTDMPLVADATGDGLYIVCLGRNTDDELMLYAAPVSGGTNDSAYENAIRGDMPADVDMWFLGLTRDQEKLLDRVTSLSIIPGYYDDGEIVWNYSGGDRPIDAVKFTMGMLKESDYQTYLDMGKDDDFRKRMELTFSRIVYFDFAASKGNLALVP